MVKLIVGNLPPSATNQSLKEIFYEYEDIQDYKLISNYGFVYLESEESAMHAVYNLNGVEYRGFQITVNYSGENINKRKIPNTIEPSPYFKAPVAQNRNTQQIMEQGNLNPYNLSYPNSNNGIAKSFDISQEKRYGPQQPMFEVRNKNPYNLPGQALSAGAPRTNNAMIDRRYGPQSFQDHRYSSMAYPNVTNMQQVQYGAFNDYSEQYVEEDDYYSNTVPLKRARPDPFMEYDTYGFGQNKPADYTEDEFRPFRENQPTWVDARQMKMRTTYLHPRDDTYYRPRGRMAYEQHKSYIDEYEDDRDYGDIDPYPAYLKQYKK